MSKNVTNLKAVNKSLNKLSNNLTKSYNNNFVENKAVSYSLIGLIVFYIIVVNFLPPDSFSLLNNNVVRILCIVVICLICLLDPIKALLILLLLLYQFNVLIVQALIQIMY